MSSKGSQVLNKLCQISWYLCENLGLFPVIALWHVLSLSLSPNLSLCRNRLVLSCVRLSTQEGPFCQKHQSETTGQNGSWKSSPFESSGQTPFQMFVLNVQKVTPSQTCHGTFNLSTCWDRQKNVPEGHGKASQVCVAFGPETSFRLSSPLSTRSFTFAFLFTSTTPWNIALISLISHLCRSIHLICRLNCNNFRPSALDNVRNRSVRDNMCPQWLEDTKQRNSSRASCARCFPLGWGAENHPTDRMVREAPHQLCKMKAQNFWQTSSILGLSALIPLALTIRPSCPIPKKPWRETLLTNCWIQPDVFTSRSIPADNWSYNICVSVSCAKYVVSFLHKWSLSELRSTPFGEPGIQPNPGFAPEYISGTETGSRSRDSLFVWHRTVISRSPELRLVFSIFQHLRVEVYLPLAADAKIISLFHFLLILPSITPQIRNKIA